MIFMRKFLVFINIALYSFLLFFILFVLGLSKVDAEQVLPKNVFFDDVSYDYNSTTWYTPSNSTTFVNSDVGKYSGVFKITSVVNYRVSISKATEYNENPPVNAYAFFGTNSVKMVKTCEIVSKDLYWYNFTCTYTLNTILSNPYYLILQYQNPKNFFGFEHDGYLSALRISTSIFVTKIEDNNVNDTVIGASQDIINNANKNYEETKKQLEESNNTSKSILQNIIELPKTIINLLTDALKSLFIPSDDFWQNNFNDVEDLIEKKLGVLGYPFILVNNTLNFFLTLDDSNDYVITWNDVKVPNFNYVIIPAGSYDLGSVLEDSNIKYAHDLYMLCLNALILLSFVKLCHNKYVDVFGGQYDDTEYIVVEDSVTDVVDTDRGKRYFTRKEKRRVKAGDEE